MTLDPQAADAAQALTALVEIRGTTGIVTARGELDLMTAPRLRLAFDDAFRPAPETLLADLTGVTFIDSAGIHALLDAHQRALAYGIRLVIVPPPQPVRLTFQIAGLDGLLPFIDGIARDGDRGARR